MYEFIELINFGKHKRLKVNIDEYVTVIQGESNSGKSTVFAGVKLVAHNKPSSPDKKFNHKYSKTHPFKIIIGKDGHVIVRTKKDYILDNGKPQNAFGTNVPEQIGRILNLKTINWQSQLVNQHYLVFESPGGIARIINKEIGFEDSLLLINAIKEEMSETKSEYKRLQANIKENEETKKRLQPILPLLKEAEDLRAFEEHVYALIEQEEDLNKLLKDTEKIQLSMADAEEIKNCYKETIELEKLHDSIERKMKDILELKKLVKEIEHIRVIDHKILQGIMNEFDELTDYENEMAVSQEREKKLEKLLKDIEAHKEAIKIGKDEQNKIQAEYDQMLMEMKICPFRDKPCPLAKGK